MTIQPIGIHHVTAITDDAKRNYHFFTEVLGMRLVKKTVNQDDIHTYHTFFADDEGSPGTDVTFFDFPGISKGTSGTSAISRVGLRVPNDAALDYYLDRFKEYNVKNDGIQTLFGKKILPFEETDGQRYQLFSDEHDEGIASGIPWKKGPVPTDKAIYGLGPVEITVNYFEEFKKVLFDTYGMTLVQEKENTALIETGKGGNGGQIILKHGSGKISMQGYGQVHHVSFRVKDHEALKQWEGIYDEKGMHHSGLVDRFYFEALYTRVSNILIELSTDGPGFTGDEPYETLGESLSLPPFLESQRTLIESQIKPFDTSRS